MYGRKCYAREIKSNILIIEAVKENKPYLSWEGKAIWSAHIMALRWNLYDFPSVSLKLYVTDRNLQMQQDPELS